MQKLLTFAAAVAVAMGAATALVAALLPSNVISGVAKPVPAHQQAVRQGHAAGAFPASDQEVLDAAESDPPGSLSGFQGLLAEDVSGRGSEDASLVTDVGNLGEAREMTTLIGSEEGITRTMALAGSTPARRRGTLGVADVQDISGQVGSVDIDGV